MTTLDVVEPRLELEVEWPGPLGRHVFLEQVLLPVHDGLRVLDGVHHLERDIF